MNSSPHKLPVWLFIVSDLALIGAAALIAYTVHPLSTTHILLIVGCVGLGAIVGLVPLVLRYEQQKNETLDDRQRALEALARTVASSAEQISIATNGLHEIGEIAQKNLKHAEQLPHKLQDKIAEFQAQLATAEDAEREELERELLSLRTTESERLESVSQRIAKSAAEWTKLEAATQQHLTAANEALSKLSLGTASAIGKAQAAAEQALGQARIEAAKNIGEASGQAARAIETAKTKAVADLEAAVTAALDRATRALDAKIAQIERVSHPTSAVAPTAPEAPAATPSDARPVSEASPGPSHEEPAPAPKRTRKPRREEAHVEPAVAAEGSTIAIATTEEPTPVPAEKIAEVAAVAPHTTDPFESKVNGDTPVPAAAATEPSTTETPAAGENPVATAAGESIATEPPKAKKRAAKKAESHPAEPEPALALDLEEPPASSNGGSERVLSSDGATRLLVTAYIGIGNRLFIRGEGAGLNWDKGVPLQFVSIGKWRWETNDASAPLQFKLFKNDEVECAALGAQTLEPGYQQELTAPF